jgi:hypothetical protein
MTENVNELMKNLEINENIDSESELESVNKMIENLEINYERDQIYIDYYEKLHDAYTRYNYILRNVEFTIQTFFIEHNIETFIDHFMEYKMDTFLLYKFSENIDYQIELYLEHLSI